MAQILLHTRGPGETRRLGARMARHLSPGCLVAFHGELGSGKTTLIQGIVLRLTRRQATSPSFVLVHEYPGKVPVYHFDFYRLGTPGDLESIGWDEYLRKGILLVEWADRIPPALPERRISVRMRILRNRWREIRITLPPDLSGGNFLKTDRL